MEPMLRLIFADSGTPDDLAASLRELRAWADDRLAAGARQCEDYLATGGPFPDRLDLLALFAEFFGKLYALTGEWAQHAETDVTRWAATTGTGQSPHTRRRLQAVVNLARSRGLTDTGEAAPAPSGPANGTSDVHTG
jgi:PadR family transcriptional regulator AphA